MDANIAALVDNLFSATDLQWTGLESLANQALTNGINKFQDQDYEGAAKAFKRAFGLSPNSSFAYEATRYASISYQMVGDTGNAIRAYETAIEVNQTDDRLQLELGNLYYGQNRYGEAIEAYEEAVRLYDDSTNRFSLGQGYIAAGRYQDAENQFDKIIDRGGLESRNGYFGMGQSLRAQKQYDKAIDMFERAVSVDREFFGAYEEIGYTYADAGKMDDANEIKDYLYDKGADTSAALLSGYIQKMTSPKIMFAFADSTFPYYQIPQTDLSVIDSYLANADATKSFSMVFQFNKDMDPESVENITNWNIERSTESAPGMRYNHGRAVPSTEVSPPLFPSSVYYDRDAMTATVRFSLTQNSTADGTIDPSHMVFAFKGKDADDNDMDTNYDQFMGFSKSF